MSTEKVPKARATELAYDRIEASIATLKLIGAPDRRIVGLRHRRNFGKARALANGFRVAQGDVVVTMDGDLQDDPAELAKFLAKLDEGYDVAVRIGDCASSRSAGPISPIR